MDIINDPFDWLNVDFATDKQDRWGGAISIYARAVYGDTVIYPKRIEIKERVIRADAVTLDCDPLMRISRESAISLMDALWNSGIRPSDGVGAAHEAATILSRIIMAANGIAKQGEK